MTGPSRGGAASRGGGRSSLAALLRYFRWRGDRLFRPAYFPLWCDTGTGADAAPRHVLDADGAVVWNVAADPRLPHADHIELSGFHVSAIIAYGAAGDGRPRLHRHLVFPGLRTWPDGTRGSLSHNFPASAAPRILVDGALVEERLVEVRLDGRLALRSSAGGLSITRTFLPAAGVPAVIERLALVNTRPGTLILDVHPVDYRRTRTGIGGPHRLVAGLASADGRFEPGRSADMCRLLEPGEELVLYQVYGAAARGERLVVHVHEEEQARAKFLDGLRAGLSLETPEPELDAAFAFARIRACESIFATPAGLMHSPGGGSYYAAIWTNDQCEYTAPVLSFLGYRPGLEAAETCLRLFDDRRDPGFARPLVSSIVAGGKGTWSGAGDRGDAAMFAYGAARFTLASGEAATAERLWDGIVWGIEFSLRRRNAEGVVRSDSDELEGRLPAGEANLFTSCLTYDALVSAAHLAEALADSGVADPGTAERYRDEADALREAIERYFGARVEGFDTYRYFAGNDVLRAWLCVPLTVGILDRAEGTTRALFSERLWTGDGLRSQAGSDTFWDRATLFALRGTLAAGHAEEALPRLRTYTRRRLLGEHVPYPVEASSEGNQRHLSAESALYLRVYTEGLFGIRPTGLHSFELCPRLPDGWPRMALRHVRAFAEDFDVEVRRDGSGVRLTVRTADRVVLDTATPDGARTTVAFEESALNPRRRGRAKGSP